MKKFIAMIVVVCILVFSVSALADFDFSEYTMDELLAIRNDLNFEIFQRNSNNNPSSLLNPGVYVVGKDIASGDYIFTLVFLCDNYSSIFVKNPVTDYNDKALYKVAGATHRFILTEGMTIEVYNGIWDVQSSPAFAFAP